MKLLLVAALLLGGSRSATAADEPAIDYDAIALIRCGDGLGTAFWIAPGRMISAAHVTARGPCTLGGAPLEVVLEDGGNDIAELRGPDSGRALPVRCSQMSEGRPYFAVGFALGRYRHTSRLVATGERAAGPPGQGQSVLLGTVYPGMSGGPVFDRRGRVTGIVNMRGTRLPLSFSRPLRETFVCRRPPGRSQGPVSPASKALRSGVA
jgi:trypsin-like peptidase